MKIKNKTFLFFINITLYLKIKKFKKLNKKSKKIDARKSKIRRFYFWLI